MEFAGDDADLDDVEVDEGGGIRHREQFNASVGVGFQLPVIESTSLPRHVFAEGGVLDVDHSLVDLGAR